MIQKAYWGREVESNQGNGMKHIDDTEIGQHVSHGIYPYMVM